jgi:ATP-binding cassette subfamily F protein 3
MNSSYEGDVYPVDVSITSFIPSSPPPREEPSTVTQVRRSSGSRAARDIETALLNIGLYLSDICYPSQYDPDSLQYMLDFFRNVAQTIPSSSSSPPSEAGGDGQQHEAVPIEPMTGSARDMLQDRAGIIVLREDLDFYAIPPKREIDQTDMIEVKRAAGRALLKQDGIFSGLRKSEEPGTTEQHLIEMLTAG